MMDDPILPAPAGEVYTDDGPVDWEALRRIPVGLPPIVLFLTTYDPVMSMWRHDRESNQQQWPNPCAR